MEFKNYVEKQEMFRNAKRNGEEVPFNYFHTLFIRKVREKTLDLQKNRIGEDTEFDFYPLPKKENVLIYGQTLHEICTMYASFSNSALSIIPSNPFMYVELLLKEENSNSYLDSFVQSLQFIFTDYIAVLGKGSPSLFRTEDETLLATLNIILNARYEITDFDAINMDLLEETKLLNKLVSMECENKIGPLPKTYVHIRRDYK